MTFVFRNLREHDISNLYFQYSFVFTFTNISLTIRQEQTSLLNIVLAHKDDHMLGHALCHALSFHSQTITHSITNNGCAVETIAAQPKQWLHSPTYCYEGRSHPPTLLRTIRRRPSRSINLVQTAGSNQIWTDKFPLLIFYINTQM